MRRLLRLNGTVTDFTAAQGRKALAKVLDADILMAKIPMANPPGHVMLVDDSGEGKRTKAINQQATDLFRAEHPDTTHVIRGLAVIVPATDVPEDPLP